MLGFVNCIWLRSEVENCSTTSEICSNDQKEKTKKQKQTNKQKNKTLVLAKMNENACVQSYRILHLWKGLRIDCLLRVPRHPVPVTMKLGCCALPNITGPSFSASAFGNFYLVLFFLRNLSGVRDTPFRNIGIGYGSSLPLSEAEIHTRVRQSTFHWRSLNNRCGVVTTDGKWAIWLFSWFITKIAEPY